MQVYILAHVNLPKDTITLNQEFSEVADLMAFVHKEFPNAKSYCIIVAETKEEHNGNG
jgi:hypothetical protein